MDFSTTTLSWINIKYSDTWKGIKQLQQETRNSLISEPVPAIVSLRISWRKSTRSHIGMKSMK